jgi:GT2 family glycosyltransferase
MLLSIVVLSYNRPIQIERILKNFIGFKDDRVQLIIKDDVSPRFTEIEKIVNDYNLNKLDTCVKLIKNHKNLGYDLNLLDSFWAVESDYIFLLSDDDFIKTELLSELLNILSFKNHTFYFTPYYRNGFLNRYNISNYNIENFVDIIYNSILFSGLIFERNSVIKMKLNKDFLANSLSCTSNSLQVPLFKN